jgi:hypothetical protein
MKVYVPAQVVDPLAAAVGEDASEASALPQQSRPRALSAAANLRATAMPAIIGRPAPLMVDTNEQIPRLSALQADLGRLGRITTRPALSHSWSEVGSSSVAVDP